VTNGLSRRFGGVAALEQLSLQVPAGVIFGFLGPNGAGKTTAIRLLLGLLEPTSGHAQVLGFDTATQGAEIRARAGALLENSGLYERLSAEDNLAFYARVARMAPAACRARVNELLVRLGLWERRRDLVGVWSAGMKRKLAVARAVVHRPKIVFLDEPSAGLDPISATSMHEDIRQLVRDEGTTVVLTTHSMREAEQLCDLVAVIHQGKLVDCGTPNALCARAGTTRTEIAGTRIPAEAVAQIRARPEVRHCKEREGRLILELAEGASVAPLVGLLVACGAQIEEVRPRAQSLEDAFVALVRDAAT
jgi:ABC-2 type transport system ATP-binding protein